MENQKTEALHVLYSNNKKHGIYPIYKKKMVFICINNKVDQQNDIANIIIIWPLAIRWNTETRCFTMRLLLIIIVDVCQRPGVLQSRLLLYLKLYLECLSFFHALSKPNYHAYKKNQCCEILMVKISGK